MPKPQILRVIDDYRKKVDSLDDATQRDLARRWLDMMSGLQKDIDRLAEEIARRQSVGGVVTQQMLWKMETYQRLMRELEALISQEYAGTAARVITKAQSSAFIMGVEAADDAIAVSVKGIGAVAPLWEKVNMGAYLSALGAAQDGSPLIALLKNAYPLAADAIADSILEGIVRGWGAKKIADDIVTASGMGLERALLISRTEVARAYRVGSVEEYRQSGVVNGFYRLVKKATACFGCLMLDGEHFDLADDLTDHPRGKCDVIADVMGLGRPDWQLGKSWFENDLSSDQQIKRMGRTKWEMWQAGEVSLDDLIGWTRSDVWGDHPRIKTLKELGYVPPVKPPKTPAPAPKGGGGISGGGVDNTGVVVTAPQPPEPPAPVSGGGRVIGKDALTADNDIYGVIGSPLQTKLSDAAHDFEIYVNNRKFEPGFDSPHIKLRESYLDIGRGDLPAFIDYRNNMYKLYFGEDWEPEFQGTSIRIKVYLVDTGELTDEIFTGYLSLDDAKDYVRYHPRAKIFEVDMDNRHCVLTGNKSQIIVERSADIMGAKKLNISGIRDISVKKSLRYSAPEVVRFVDQSSDLSDIEKMIINDYVKSTHGATELWSVDELHQLWGAIDDVYDRFPGMVSYGMTTVTTPLIQDKYWNACFDPGNMNFLFNGRWTHSVIDTTTHYSLSIRGVAAHEIGHSIQRYGLSASQRDEWNKLYRKTVMSVPGLRSRFKDDPGEGFAEAVAAYMDGIEITPEITAFLDSL